MQTQGKTTVFRMREILSGADFEWVSMQLIPPKGEGEKPVVQVMRLNRASVAQAVELWAKKGDGARIVFESGPAESEEDLVRRYVAREDSR